MLRTHFHASPHTHTPCSLNLEYNPAFPRQFQVNTYWDRAATQQLLHDISSYFVRHERCQASVITLLCVRRFRRGECGALSVLDMETWREIARVLWTMRDDDAWARDIDQRVCRCILQ